MNSLWVKKERAGGPTFLERLHDANKNNFWSSVGRLDRAALIGLDRAEVPSTIEKRKESAVEGSEKATPMVIGHGGRANWGQPTHICALGVRHPGAVPHQPGSVMCRVQ